MVDVFLHIPKCGGSTIRSAIMNKYSGKNVVRVYGDREKGYNFSVSNFQSGFLSLKSNVEIKAVCGHIKYQVFHDYFAEEIDSLRFFSFLRDPIERGISNINYMKANIRHRSHEKALRINKENVFEFLSKPSNSNFQYKYLGGTCGFAVDEVIERVQLYKLEDYKIALRELGLVGSGDIIERKNSTTGLKSKNGLDSLSLLTIDDLSAQELETLRELNSKDYQLISNTR